MKHLINNSVYEKNDFLDRIDADGIELLTGFGKVDRSHYGNAVGVHLPFCTDWYGIFTGRKTCAGVTPDEAKYLYFGRNRDEIISNVRASIANAAELKPEYGVFHACSANTDELMERKYSDSDDAVVHSLAEMMNSVVSKFPSGEPPFRILFENLWWPGMRLTDESGFRILKNELEFDNWGICLDTGHLLISMGGAETEKEAVEMLMRKIGTYSDELMDSIQTVHLHVNTSADKIRKLETPEGFLEKCDMDRLKSAYHTIVEMDQHRPFSESDAVGIIDAVKPMFVNHEMHSVQIPEKLSEYRTQRRLFY